MDCSLPGFSIHGIFQARLLEWVAISFSRGSSRLRGWTWVSHIVDRFFIVWATRVWEDAWMWTHKNLYLKTSIWRPVFFVVVVFILLSFAEHRVPYFLSPPWTPFKGVLKVSILQWSWFNLCRGSWQGPTFSQQGPFKTTYLTMFWVHFMVTVSRGVGRLIPRSNKDSIDRPLNVLSLDQAL